MIVDARMLQAVQNLTREISRLADEEGQTRARIARLLERREDRIAELTNMAATLMDRVME